MNTLMPKFQLNKSLSSFLPVILIAWAALITGCAAPATYVGMTPTGYDIVKKHPNTVSVVVKGGSETSPMWKSQISNEDFSQALTDSINNSKTFSRVIAEMGADYELYITIFSVEQPNFGFSFTVKMEIGWSLKRTGSKDVVWQESIKSEYTATTSDAFVGATRLRMATEGAARNNITEGLSKISKLNL